MSVHGVQRDPHRVSECGCDAWQLVRASELSVVKQRIPAGRSALYQCPAHVGGFVFVLEGTLCLEVDGVTQSVPPASGVEIGAGVTRRLHSAGTRDLWVLLISAPASHQDPEIEKAAYECTSVGVRTPDPTGCAPSGGDCDVAFDAACQWNAAR